jgi:Ser/Thr protein kinase RdoA (MazF antagonist)
MNLTAHAHGMDGTLVEADWPPLERDEVRAVLENYAGFDGSIEILSTSPRPFSATSVVLAGGKSVFIKRHHRSVRDKDGLREEHRFIDYLRRRGAAVPAVLLSIGGETAIEKGAWTYEVHEAATGIDLYEEAVSWTPFHCAAHARSAGQALARLHEAAEGFVAPARKTQPLVSSFSIFAGSDAAGATIGYLEARPALANDRETRDNCKRALELLGPFREEISPLLPALKPLWTHNDLHASNLFWSDGSDDSNAVTIIDFGLADRTNAVYDLALAIERNVIEWLKLGADDEADEKVPVHIDHMLALLDGYESERPLAVEERAALAPMLALCHVEFALTEADYFLGVLHSRDKARLAMDGYLVGHARWFRSECGERLLNVLRRWASDRSRAGSKP